MIARIGLDERPYRARARILHVCDKFGIEGATFHGVTRLFSWWFPRWDGARFDCRLVGLRQPDASSELLREAGIPVRMLGKGRFDPSTYGALARIAREEQIDILHLHGFGASDFGRVLALRARLPAIVHEHAALPCTPIYQRMADAVLAPATTLGVAVSRSVLDYMATTRFISRARLRLVPNGAPLAEFAPVDLEAAAAARARWRVSVDRPVIGAIGRLNEQKGVSFLIQAAAILAAKGVAFTLMLVGDGGLLGALQAEAAALGLAERVIFTGFLRDARAEQTLFDIQVFPSLFEGAPLTLFEAMAMGRPIVSTDVDGLGETLRDGETALLAPPRDPVALAAAIGRLLADRDFAAHLAANARADSARWDIANSVAALQDIYEEVLWGRARSADALGDATPT